jgi:hypothetical protein
MAFTAKLSVQTYLAISEPFFNACLIRLWISLIHSTVVQEKLPNIHGKQAAGGVASLVQ